MAIHDTTPSRRGSLIPEMGRGNLTGDTRRVNQNVEIISIKGVLEAIDEGVVNGQTSIIELNFENIQNDGTVGAFWEMVVYVDSEATTNILYPYHSDSTVDLSDWQILGLAGSLIPNSGSATNATTTYQEKAAFRNISAGTVDLIYQVRPRYIYNRG